MGVASTDELVLDSDSSRVCICICGSEEPKRRLALAECAHMDASTPPSISSSPSLLLLPSRAGGLAEAAANSGCTRRPTRGGECRKERKEERVAREAVGRKEEEEEEVEAAAAAAGAAACALAATVRP